MIETYKSARARLIGLALLAGIGALGACGGKGFSEPITLGGRVVEPQTLERGRDLYNRYCATCHGIDGKAQTSQARALDPKPRDFTAAPFKHKAEPGDGLPTDADMGKVIKNGVPGTGMPAWPNLDEKDLDAVIQYIKTLSPRWRTGASASAPNESVAMLPHPGAASVAAVGHAKGAGGTTIGGGHRPLWAGVESRFPGATFVLPAPHDTVSFRAAFTPRLARLGPAPSEARLRRG